MKFIRLARPPRYQAGASVRLQIVLGGSDRALERMVYAMRNAAYAQNARIEDRNVQTAAAER